MMKQYFVTQLIFALLMISFSAAFSQCKEWKWPEDAEQKAKAEEKVSLYDDYRKNNEFAKAKPPLNWLLTNTPNLNTSIYINGSEIYQKLATAEKDPTKKSILVDSLLTIYDLRIQYCGEEANVINRKALAAAAFWANETGKEKYVLDLMDQAFKLNGNDVLDGTIMPYMQVVRINKVKLKNLTDEQVLERYDIVMNVLDAKIKVASSQGKQDLVTRYRSWKDEVDKILISIVKVDCDFVRTNLGPKFKANPSDIGLAKKIFAFMLQDKCTDDPLWIEAAEAVNKVEKDYGIAKNLAIRYLASENYTKANQYFKEAYEYSSTGSEKADILIYQGAIEARKGSKSAARDLYRQALTADGSKKEAYEKIGDLYYQSFPDCAKKESMAEDRLVYLAAYDMYQRAGESKKMASAKDQFPSKEDIFLVNWTAGDTQRVGCWINESVTIRTRD
ncbi:MAG: tetratricopeptide repeat protein [Cyclobacteriaceae bacterium]|nr:tetratricopeptide repeat protein [Cyclobacteriaceae bacterium]